MVTPETLQGPWTVLLNRLLSLHTAPSDTVVVWFPDSKTAAYTVLPSGLTARARGVSPKSSMIESGTPSSVVPRSSASNAQTRARGVLGVVSSGGTDAGRFCPRRAVVMKARLLPGPAKTMSRGSSPTRRVRTTRGGSEPTSTMLTLSDKWFTTQTSLALRAATATGSIPTGTDAARRSPPPFRSKISRRSSGVFTANSRVPSGDSASGRTWPLSKVTNEASAADAQVSAPIPSSRPRRRGRPAPTATDESLIGSPLLWNASDRCPVLCPTQLLPEPRRSPGQSGMSVALSEEGSFRGGRYAAHCKGKGIRTKSLPSE